MKNSRIAIIIQRFGKEVNGGAEVHCRLLALALKEKFDVAILTTCAKDYHTWQPEYEEGESIEEGLRIIRFENDQRAPKSKINRIRHKIMQRLSYYPLKLLGILPKPSAQAVLEDHQQWLELQGPATPDLIEYLKRESFGYDVLIFFSFLYYPTAMGVFVDPKKSILIPTVHDEKASYFPGYKPVLHAPEWIIYNSPAEKQLAEKIFDVEHKKNLVAGVGIELPMMMSDSKYLTARNITTPYIIYIGRIDKGKGCQQLIDHFISFKKKFKHPLQLVMVGQPYMQLPQHEDVIFTGFVSDEEKVQLMQQSQAVVIPSKYESLSMVLLESFYLSKPVLVNAHCEVLKEHITKSKGGLVYASEAEFDDQLHTLLTNNELVEKLAENGKIYVEENYSWKSILSKIEIAIDDIISSK